MASNGLYNTLKATAEKWVLSTSFAPPATSPDKAAIRSLCTPEYKQSWGHEHSISNNPRLGHVLDLDGFFAHLDAMTPKLDSASAQVTDVTVDERQRKVVVRARYQLSPKGAKEKAPPNDLIWVLTMNEQGTKVTSGQEFLDALAVAELGRIMKAAAEAANGS